MPVRTAMVAGFRLLIGASLQVLRLRITAACRHFAAVLDICYSLYFHKRETSTLLDVYMSLLMAVNPAKITTINLF